jgi:flagellar hook-basal body complex protein FliE
MSIPKLPEDVGATEPIFPTKPLELTGREEGGGGQSFASIMSATPTPMQAAGKSSLISPFELTAGQPITQVPTADTLFMQLQQARGTANDIYEQLNIPNLAQSLKPFQKQLLKNKLLDTNQKLRSANALMGAEVAEPMDPTQFKGPLGRFFAYLTDGQKLMESASKQLKTLGQGQEPLNAGDFLNVQVKIGKAQQMLEFVSVLLANSVQAFKTLMQVQI